jgi:hypothetical protein
MSLFVLELLVLRAALQGALWDWQSWPVIARFRRPTEAAPQRRALHLIAEDARRISARYHQPGQRFAQFEGRRRAFDQVLAEAADTLEIEHLLGVLPPGVELDRERARVESRLVALGVLHRRDAA